MRASTTLTFSTPEKARVISQNDDDVAKTFDEIFSLVRKIVELDRAGLDSDGPVQAGSFRAVARPRGFKT